MKNCRNLFSGLSEVAQKESVLDLVKEGPVRIQRIISHGQTSPPGFWYDQDEHEWVAVLSGQAVLQIEGREEEAALRPGDTLHLPPHLKHRVKWTDPLQPTVWLAVFWRS